MHGFTLTVKKISENNSAHKLQNTFSHTKTYLFGSKTDFKLDRRGLILVLQAFLFKLLHDPLTVTWLLNLKDFIFWNTQHSTFSSLLNELKLVVSSAKNSCYSQKQCKLSTLQDLKLI